MKHDWMEEEGNWTLFYRKRKRMEVFDMNYFRNRSSLLEQVDQSILKWFVCMDRMIHIKNILRKVGDVVRGVLREI